MSELLTKWATAHPDVITALLGAVATLLLTAITAATMWLRARAARIATEGALDATTAAIEEAEPRPKASETPGTAKHAVKNALLSMGIRRVLKTSIGKLDAKHAPRKAKGWNPDGLRR